jgi:hypothetical protein
VDVVARFIAACSGDPASCGRTFHLTHPRPLGAEDWAEVLRRHGMRARTLSNEEWMRQFLERSTADMRRLFELRAMGGNRTILECFGDLTFDSTGFHRQLEAYDIRCPDYETMVAQGWLDTFRPKRT